jgi:hypothetical protein
MDNIKTIKRSIAFASSLESLATLMADLRRYFLSILSSYSTLNIPETGNILQLLVITSAFLSLKGL